MDCFREVADDEEKKSHSQRKPVLLSACGLYGSDMYFAVMDCFFGFHYR